jgi:hypothetical protein
MKLVAEYRNHAQENRVLAQQMPLGHEREQLLRMARAWERLAETREELIRRCRRARAVMTADADRSRLWRLHLRALQWNLVRLRQARWREADTHGAGRRAGMS